jgi:hypothetical protein
VGTPVTLGGGGPPNWGNWLMDEPSPIGPEISGFHASPGFPIGSKTAGVDWVLFPILAHLGNAHARSTWSGRGSRFAGDCLRSTVGARLNLLRHIGAVVLRWCALGDGGHGLGTPPRWGVALVPAVTDRSATRSVLLAARGTIPAGRHHDGGAMAHVWPGLCVGRTD